MLDPGGKPWTARGGEESRAGGAPASPPAQGFDCSGVIHLIFRSRIPFVPRLAEPPWCLVVLLEQPRAP